MRLILSGADIIKLYPDLVRVLHAEAKYKIVSYNGCNRVLTLSNEAVAVIEGEKMNKTTIYSDENIRENQTIAAIAAELREGSRGKRIAVWPDGQWREIHVGEYFPNEDCEFFNLGDCDPDNDFNGNYTEFDRATEIYEATKIRKAP